VGLFIWRTFFLSLSGIFLFPFGLAGPKYRLKIQMLCVDGHSDFDKMGFFLAKFEVPKGVL